MAFITQFLAMLGVAASINTLVWTYGVFLAMTTINIVYLLMMGYAYDTVTAKVLNDANADAVVAKSQMKREFVMFFGWTAAMTCFMYVDYTKWDQGQKMATASTSEQGA